MAGFAERNQLKQELLADVFVCEVMHFRGGPLAATFTDAAGSRENKCSTLCPSVGFQVLVVVSEERVSAELRLDHFR